MRALGEDFAAHLAGRATTLCTCWRIARTDGLVLGFTDHDQALCFDGIDYLPALEGGEAAQKLGPMVATAEVLGVLHADAISEDDILCGRYDGALVECFRVNWQDVGQRLLLTRATIGDIRREDGLFRAELRSGQQALNVPKGRVYQALCDAELGDARCGVDLGDPSRRAAATVVTLLDRFRVTVAGIEGFAPGWFGLGVAAWVDGRRQGLRDRVLSQQRQGGADVLSFAAPVGDWLAPGDGLVLTAGCDRRFATCREKFGNAANFRGFPHIPGNDFVLRYPREGNALDGRKLVG